MIGRIVEIVTPVQLHKDYGRLVLKDKQGVLEVIPFDDISCVIIHPHGAMLSAAVLTELAVRNISFISLGDNYLPAGYLTPVVSHFHQAKRLETQLALPAPARKQLWKAFVKNKIMMQSAVLHHVGADRVAGTLEKIAESVKSGDTDNREGYAARSYFPALFGTVFIRDRQQEGLNSLLNYGYAVIRAAAVRYLLAAGLNLSLGLHHKNAYDSFRLADDIMEPYRPLVDLKVYRILKSGVVLDELDVGMKKNLVRVLIADMETTRGTTPVSVGIQYTAQTLAKHYTDQTKPVSMINPENEELLTEISRLV